jgi:nucleotide-binding universal stress UspA family protein
MGTIVVGIDGSDGSRHALRWALAEAGAHGWPVRAVMAEPNGEREYVQPVPGARHVPVPPFEERVERARETLTELVEQVLAEEPMAGVAVDRAVLAGDPVEVLVAAAEGAELLVLGARGMGAIKALVLGSVSQACVARARTPVVIIPPAMAAAA